VGRQEPLLFGHRPGDPGMTVTDHGHVVVAVEIPPTLRVEQPDALAADQVHRAGVEQRRPGQHEPTPLQEIAGGGPVVGQPPAGFLETPRDGVYAHCLDTVQECAGPGLAAHAVGGVARV